MITGFSQYVSYSFMSYYTLTDVGWFPTLSTQEISSLNQSVKFRVEKTSNWW